MPPAPPGPCELTAMARMYALRWSIVVIVCGWTLSATMALSSGSALPRSIAVMAGIVAVRAAAVTAIAWFLMLANGESPADLGLRAADFRRALLRGAAYGLVAFVLVNVVLGSILERGDGSPPPIAALFRNPRELPLWIFMTVVGGGFTEELARAFVLTRFERAFSKTGLWFAVVVDTAVFAMGHLYQGPAGAVQSGVCGLLLVLVFLKRRRAADAVVTHTVFDLVGVASAYALYGATGWAS